MYFLGVWASCIIGIIACVLLFFLDKSNAKNNIRNKKNTTEIAFPFASITMVLCIISKIIFDNALVWYYFPSLIGYIETEF